MSSYFYALIEADQNIEGDEVFEFFEDDDGFSILLDSINEIRAKKGIDPLKDNVNSIRMVDISSHGVFIRPREVNIDNGYFAGDAGCFITPLILKKYIDDDYGLKVINKYIELNALMFVF